MAASACFKETQFPLDHSKWPPEIMTAPLKYMAVSAPLKLQYV